MAIPQKGDKFDELLGDLPAKGDGTVPMRPSFTDGLDDAGRADIDFQFGTPATRGDPRRPFLDELRKQTEHLAAIRGGVFILATVAVLGIVLGLLEAIFAHH